VALPDPPAGRPVHYAVVGKPEPGVIAGLDGLELVLSLNAGIEYLLGLNEKPEVPIVRMVDPGLVDGMVEWVAAQVLAEAGVIPIDHESPTGSADREYFSLAEQSADSIQPVIFHWLASQDL
jgi:phosphoglycerate dehydrogenase-like enzyme